MHLSSILSVAFLSLALPLFTAAGHHGPSARRHNALATRQRGDVSLPKRETNARLTFYAVGLGACGKNNVPSDFIVALNSCQYGGGYPGPHCFKSITITYNGKSIQATIMDECPGCPCGGLDLSEGAFKALASLDAGVIYADWHYNDGSGGDDPKPAPEPKPKKSTSSYTPPATSSSSWVDPSPWTSETSSSKSKSSTSTSYTSTSTSSISTSTSTSKTSASTSTSSTAAPTPTYTTGGSAAAPQNIEGLNALLVELGKFVVQYSA